MKMLVKNGFKRLPSNLIERNLRILYLNPHKHINSDVSSSKNPRVTPIQMAYSSYESIKPTSSPSPCPVVIMHGLLGSKSNWRSLSKMLHLKTHRKIMCVDARNHGDSPHSEYLSYSHLAEDVRSFMELLKIPRASLVGHSMGGRAMMLAALSYPELVKSLVVVDISPVGTSRSIHLIATFLKKMKEIELPSQTSLHAAKKMADAQLSKNIHDAGIRQFLLTNLVETENGGFKWRVNLDVIQSCFAKHVADFPPVDRVFEGPTLFVAGGDSDYIRPEEHDSIRRLFPAAEFETIPSAGHWVHSDQPAQFIQIVGSFLSRSSNL